MGSGESKAIENFSLYVTVYRCKDLLGGWMRKPFVRLILGTKIINTSFGSGSNPSFIERFCFMCSEEDTTLYVQVWDSGICFANELLGEVVIQTHYFEKEEKRVTFQLVNDEKEGYCGKIDLGIILCPPNFTVFGGNRLTRREKEYIHPPIPTVPLTSSLTPSLPFFTQIKIPTADEIIKTPGNFQKIMRDCEKQAAVEEMAQHRALWVKIEELKNEKKAMTTKLTTITDVDSEEYQDMRGQLMELDRNLDTCYAHAQALYNIRALELDENEEQALDRNMEFLTHLFGEKYANESVEKMKRTREELALKYISQHKLQAAAATSGTPSGDGAAGGDAGVSASASLNKPSYGSLGVDGSGGGIANDSGVPTLELPDSRHKQSIRTTQLGDSAGVFDDPDGAGLPGDGVDAIDGADQYTGAARRDSEASAGSIGDEKEVERDAESAPRTSRSGKKRKRGKGNRSTANMVAVDLGAAVSPSASLLSPAPLGNENV